MKNIFKTNSMDIIYLAALHWIGISQKKLSEIFTNRENYKQVFEGINEAILKKYKIQDRYIKVILERRQKVDLDFLKNKLSERQVEIVTIKDTAYPKTLLEIPNSPYILYVRGKLDNSAKFGVVGSRKITSYGEKVIENIVPELSHYFSIVSGGAYGCDTHAHKRCLEASGKTIAVIGTGIDHDYPVGNKTLYEKIAGEGGSVISIFPIGEPGNPYNFPIRNEIVAGLSVGILVVEAQERSGSLITSKLALDLGKDLFAIPGDIYKSASIGCNALIANGEAKITRNTSDILLEYNVIEDSTRDSGSKKKISLDDKIEEGIYNLLLLEPLNIDEILNKTEIDIKTLTFKISMMEIKQILKKSAGGKYELK